MLNLTLIYTNLAPYIDAFLNFIYPPHCLMCNCRLEAGKKLTCETCWQNLPRIEQNDSHGEKTIQDSFSVISVWEYSDEVQKIIHEMKYFRKTFFGSAVGDEMAKLVSASNEFSTADYVIPVPLHNTRLRERGFNQSLLLANRIAKRLNIPCEPGILNRVRYTKSQSKLSAEERIKNVQGAFKVQDARIVKNKVLILVDDVLTTGSTLNACALSLKEAGAGKILAVTAAKVN